jgi:hypothetical protein
MLLIALLLSVCSFSAAMSSSSSESSRNPPIFRVALLFGTPFSGSRASSGRFLFFGDGAWGIDELGGYAMGDETSGIAKVGGDEGNVVNSIEGTVGGRLTGDCLRRFAGVSGGISTGYSARVR